jgi:uncharacterized protein (DUF58 family)
LFTPKATAYFILTAVLLILALLLNDLEIGILILGLASLFFFSNLWGLPEKVEISLERSIVPDATFGDEDIRVESRIRNLTGSTLGNMELHEILDHRITPEKGTGHSPASLGPHQELLLVLEFPSPPRATYEIGPLIARVRDPFGFYLTEKKIGPETLSVMPRPQRLRGIRLSPRHVGPWPGVVPSKVLGLGTEFFSMREYIPGDDPKRINWKASARYNELIVNETEAERVTDVMIVLDTDVTFFGPSENELFERGVEAAASLTRLLLSQGNYLLAAAKPGRASVSTSYVMNLLARRMLPSRSQVLVISPLLDPEIREGVRQLTVAGYSLLVLSPSPTLPVAFQDQVEELAFKFVMLERTIGLRALERSSTVIDWPSGIPLSVLMSKVRSTRQMAVA